MPRVYESPKGLIVRMMGQAQGMERFQLSAAASIAVDLTAEERRILDAEIYAIPEKTSPSGRKLWIRTGALRRGERAVVQGQRVVFENSESPYAMFRHDMKTKPPQREVPFRSMALNNRRAFCLEIRRKASLRAMGG
jgi:hypothetical protein